MYKDPQCATVVLQLAFVSPSSHPSSFFLKSSLQLVRSHNLLIFFGMANLSIRLQLCGFSFTNFIITDTSIIP